MPIELFVPHSWVWARYDDQGTDGGLLTYLACQAAKRSFNSVRDCSVASRLPSTVPPSMVFHEFPSLVASSVNTWPAFG